MATVKVYGIDAQAVGEIELPETVFGVEMNTGLVHQVVVMQLASQRLGTHATKTRSMVRGGGRKPWRQKGTGRARAGSRRSPLWRSGGTVFGPSPRSYAFKMPKKQRRLALRCVLSEKLRNNELIVLDELEFEAAKTKQMVKLLSDFKVDSKALFISEEVSDNVLRSARNLQGVKTLEALRLNAYDMLNHEKLFITKGAIAKIEEVYA